MFHFEMREGPLQDPFKNFTYNINKTHGAVVGRFLWFTLNMFWHVMAKCQSVGTTAVVREFSNSLDKGPAKNVSKPAYHLRVNVIRTSSF